MHLIVFVPARFVTQVLGWAVIAGLVYVAVSCWLVPYARFLSGE